MSALALTAPAARPEPAVDRMLLLVTTGHPDMARFAHPALGRLIQPRHYSSIEATAAEGIPWAADNDCFQGLDAEAYCKMLDRIRGLDGCLWVTVPDVVADAKATAFLFERWAPALERRGLPLALVAQNGLEELGGWLERTWHRIDALFIGGDDEFKLGPEAAELAAEAHRRGKWVHVGRVNSNCRISYCRDELKADSIDGTQWARFKNTYLAKGLVEVGKPRQEHASRCGRCKQCKRRKAAAQLSLAEPAKTACDKMVIGGVVPPGEMERRDMATIEAARAEEREARAAQRRVEKLHRGAASKREQEARSKLARIIADEKATARGKRCRCGITVRTSWKQIEELGAGCTAGRWVCPTLDAIRRRMGR